MAKSKFDFSLLTPIDENNSEFEKNLQPMEEDLSEDEGSYLDSLPESEGFWKKLPRNILIGLTHAGRNLHNLPHDIAKGFESGTQDIGNTLNQLKGPKIKRTPISESLPYDPNEYGDVFGQEGDPTLMDSLIQGGIEHAPEIIGAAGLARSGLRRLKGTHQLQEVQRAIQESGLNNFGYTPETLREARSYLPSTHASREALEASSRGEYPASFSIQSQIGHHQRNLAKSSLASERLLAPRVGELKQNMLSQLESALRSSGMESEADLLRSGIRNYRQYTQFKNAVVPILKKAGIPTTVLAAVGLGYKQAKKIFKD